MRLRSITGAVLGAALAVGGVLVAPTASAAPPGGAGTGKAAAPAAAAAPFDAGFGTGGVVNNVGSALNYGADVTGLADGSILLAGTVISHAGSAPSVEFGLTRRLANGSVDPAFGVGGTAVVEAGATNLDSGPTPTAVQPDGAIVVGRQTSSFAGNQRWALARMLPNGTADPSFSGDGRLQVSFPTNYLYAYLTDVLLRPDGRILAVGFTHGLLVAAQFLPDGSFDRHFGTEGRLMLALPGTEPQTNDAELDAAGNLVVAGYAAVPDTGGDMLVGRIRPDGTPDPAFGLAGFALVDSGLGYDMAWAMDLDAQGRILLTGRIPGPLPPSQPASGTGEQTGVVRLLPDGRTDPSFGVNGRVTLPFDGPAQFNHGNSVRALPDGRIAVLSEYSADFSSIRQFVAVLTDAGHLDPTFDGGDGIGTVLTNAHSGGSLILLSSGKLLVYNLSALVRLNATTETADLSVILGADQAQAGPGPVTFTATVRNDGPAAATVSLSLNISKAATVAGSTRITCFLDKIAVNAACKPVSVPVGGTVAVSLSTVVDGYEGSVVLSATVSSPTPDPDLTDNSALAEVQTSTEYTM